MTDRPPPPLPRPAIERDARGRAVPEPELPLLHDRTYSVRSYRKSDSEIVLRGQVRDQKPPGVYVASDPDPLTVHHMVVDLTVEFPTMRIAAADVVMETHPHPTCPHITDHYRELVGLSIARGFTHKVRELFGGPRGCTHTTALLQAMAPVAVQSIWSMRSANRIEAGETGTPVPPPLPSNPTEEQIQERLGHTLNSCHVWREDGQRVEDIRNGAGMDVPLWIVERLEQLGLDPDAWTSIMAGEN